MRSSASCRRLVRRERTAIVGGTTSTSGGGGSFSSSQDITVGAAGIPKVINLLSIQGEDQVYLKVTVAEIQRNAVKQLGVDLNGGITMGAFKAAFSTDNPFPVNGVPPLNLGQAGSGDPSAGISSFNRGIFGTILALEQTGMVRTLAEPTLTAISGDPPISSPAVNFRFRPVVTRTASSPSPTSRSASG